MARARSAATVLALCLLADALFSARGWVDRSKLGSGDGPIALALDAGGRRLFTSSWNRAAIVLRPLASPGGPGRVVVPGVLAVRLEWAPDEGRLYYVEFNRPVLCRVEVDEGGGASAPECLRAVHLQDGTGGWGEALDRDAPRGPDPGHVESFALDPAGGRVWAVHHRTESVAQFEHVAFWLSSLGNGGANGPAPGGEANADADEGQGEGDGAPGPDGAAGSGEVPMARALVLEGPGRVYVWRTHAHRPLPLVPLEGGAGLLFGVPSVGRLLRLDVDRATGETSPAAEATLEGLPASVALAPSRGSVFVGDHLGPRIVELELGRLSPVGAIEAPGHVTGLHHDEVTGRLWVISRLWDAIWVLDPDGGAPCAAHALERPGPSAVDPVERVLWVASEADGRVHPFDLGDVSGAGGC